MSYDFKYLANMSSSVSYPSIFFSL